MQAAEQPQRFQLAGDPAVYLRLLLLHFCEEEGALAAAFPLVGIFQQGGGVVAHRRGGKLLKIIREAAGRGVGNPPLIFHHPQHHLLNVGNPLHLVVEGYALLAVADLVLVQEKRKNLHGLHLKEGKGRIFLILIKDML